MKTFIGLDFDRKTKVQIGNIQKKLKSKASKGSWVYIDNLHLTLKYLGTTSPSKLEEIKSKLQSIASNQSSIKLKYSDLGYFRGKDILRVLYLDLEGEINKIHDMKSQIDDKLETIGYSREKKRYIPHITLGRRIIFNSRIHSINESIKKDLNKPLELKRLVLYKSEEVDNKRVYKPIEVFELRDWE